MFSTGMWQLSLEIGVFFHILLTLPGESTIVLDVKGFWLPGRPCGPSVFGVAMNTVGVVLAQLCHHQLALLVTARLAVLLLPVLHLRRTVLSADNAPHKRTCSNRPCVGFPHE